MKRLWKRLFFLKDKQPEQYNKTEETDRFPGINTPANELSAFAYFQELFILSLKNGRVETVKIKDKEQFRNWLLKHQVRDVTNESMEED